MMLFAAAGSWGEVQPLLALAKHTRGQFACDQKWLGFARQYRFDTWKLCDAPAHDYTIGGFLESLDMQEIFDSLYLASERATAIVSSFYLSPAKIVAELRGIPWIATTTSPIYFRELGAVSNQRMMTIEAKLNAIRAAVGLPHSDMTLVPEEVIGLYPGFLAGAEPFPVIGYPRLTPLSPVLSLAPMSPYWVISNGSIAQDDDSDQMTAICEQMGVACVHLGNGFMQNSRNFGVPFTPQLDHVGLLLGAKAAVIHGGIGTLCDAIEARVPVIVKPRAFDNFHNARMVARRGAGLWPILEPRRIDAAIESEQHIFTQFDELISQIRVAA